jgi:hypothetical protein
MQVAKQPWLVSSKYELWVSVCAIHVENTHILYLGCGDSDTVL